MFMIHQINVSKSIISNLNKTQIWDILTKVRQLYLLRACSFWREVVNNFILFINRLLIIRNSFKGMQIHLV